MHRAPANTFSRSTPPDSNVGRVLRGQYRLESKLGQGGMGVVYRGLQLQINRPVAVKLLLPGPPGEQSMREQRFRREAEATAALREQHTVRVFDFGVTERSEPFLVMELLDGFDLEHLLNRVGRLKPSLALLFARQVLLGLAEAHARGITHRDLKPSNVFLAKRHTGQFFVKVLDFGIACFDAGYPAAKLTHSGALIGTPTYMPPELLEGKPSDGRGDLYSLGVLLFEMLTGRPPFDQETVVAVLQAHLSTLPPRLRAVVSTLESPASLQSLLDRLLAKRPEERFPDCAAALRALDAVRAELRLAGYGDSAVSKVQRIEAGQEVAELQLRTPRVRRRAVRRQPPPLPRTTATGSGSLRSSFVRTGPCSGAAAEQASAEPQPRHTVLHVLVALVCVRSRWCDTRFRQTRQERAAGAQREAADEMLRQLGREPNRQRSQAVSSRPRGGRRVALSTCVLLTLVVCLLVLVERLYAH